MLMLLDLKKVSRLCDSETSCNCVTVVIECNILANILLPSGSFRRVPYTKILFP